MVFDLLVYFLISYSKFLIKSVNFLIQLIRFFFGWSKHINFFIHLKNFISELISFLFARIIVVIFVTF